MRSWFMPVVAACFACGPKSVENTRAAGAAPTTLASGMALNYNDPPGEVPRSAISDAILVALSDEATRRNRPAPVPDARLFRACTALAGVVPEDGVLGYRTVEFALQTNGIIEPSPYLLVVWGALHDPRSIVEALRPKLGNLADVGTARVGVGAVVRLPGDTGAVVLAVQTMTLQTSAIPRSLPSGGRSHFEARLASGLRDPKVSVLRPNGDIERVKLLWPGADSFGAQIECGSTIGKLQIQIVANDAHGSSSVAVFPVWCGEEPPRTASVDTRSRDVLPSDPLEAERQLLELVNGDRARAGRLPLAWDETLAEVARAHSQDMRRTDVVGFVLPGARSLEERVGALGPDARAKIRAGIARAYAISETHNGLIEQPSTRSFLMAAKVTHIGIGVVYGAEINPGMREMFVTELVRSGPP